jgi:alpha-1,3-rhamnosyl/mannosyltransferase
VVTIHDLQPLLLPANFHPVKQAYLRWRLPASAKASRLVITLTEHARRSVVERLGIESSRVVVVPPGFTLALNEAAESDPATTYGIDRPFFLFPAITSPHKHPHTLVRAFAKVVAEQPEVLLVLTSGPAQMEDAIRQEVARLGIDASVRRLGRIPRGDLDWLVRHATALTFPSRFEGFGLPVLEAMGNGCPVIAADATALPEVVGEGGLLVDPDDVDGWAAAMLEVLGDADRREWLIEAGLAQTARYQWAASTTALLDAYRRAGRVAVSEVGER